MPNDSSLHLSQADSQTIPLNQEILLVGLAHAHCPVRAKIGPDREVFLPRTLQSTYIDQDHGNIIDKVIVDGDQRIWTAFDDHGDDGNFQRKRRTNEQKEQRVLLYHLLY